MKQMVESLYWIRCVSLVANAYYEEEAGSGQISKLHTQAMLQRSELVEVYLADVSQAGAILLQ